MYKGTPEFMYPAAARSVLGIGASDTVIALLPGSRAGEVSHHAALFIEAAQRLRARVPGAIFLLPVANPVCRRELRPAMDGATLPLQLVDGQTQRVLAAADVALVASGTATLETALARRPMVVAYRTGRISWSILSRMVRAPYIALPNLLTGQRLVPEFLQDDATSAVLADALWEQLTDREAHPALMESFSGIHRALRLDCAARVAAGLRQLAGGKRP